MRDDKELAALIARAVFKALDFDDFRQCHRIEGKAIYLGKEVALGGFAEQPLADQIERVLTEYRTY